MSAKHTFTPGPWYADKVVDRNAFNIFPHGATYALVQVAPPIHDGAHPYGQAVEANARLIAAAPELLEALREIADDYADRFDMSDSSTNPGMKYVVAQARAAIAKATGSEQ